MADKGQDPGISASRRELLKLMGAGTVGGAATYVQDNTYPDGDGDGLDNRYEAGELETTLESVYNEAVELDPEQPNLLVDARYVGDTWVSNETQEAVEDLFADNGIRLQWLEYPERYDADTFYETYQRNAWKILGPHRTSFYQQEIEPFLQDTAIQLVTVSGNPDRGGVYSPVSTLSGATRAGGVSYGNRAVVAERFDPELERKLVLHEIAHYGLCHDYDNPENKGVMGTNEEFDLMEGEWEQLRTSLDSVRDTTGFDTAFRPCSWEDTLIGE